MKKEDGFPIYRHPLYLAADRLKLVFHMLGFRYIDNGEGNEVEEAGVTFATWEEPEAWFGWQRDFILIKGGAALLRTRLLPAGIRKMEQKPPVRMAAFGRVYDKTSGELYMRTHLEGFVCEADMTLAAWRGFWSQVAATLFGLTGSAELEAVGNQSYRILLRDGGGGKTYHVGYTGPASQQAMKLADISADKYHGWVFVLDVDQFALQYLELEDRSLLYKNDLDFLRRFECDVASGGYSMEYRAIDFLRKLGYVEVCGHVLYPDGMSKKMNQIQETWDSLNQPIPLMEPVEERTSLRTVFTPALETILGENWEHGVEMARIFEVGHLYLPAEGQSLPHERVAIAFAAYGPGVTMESFTADVEAFIGHFGLTNPHYFLAEIAIAYEGGAMVILDEANNSPGNFGQISKVATANFGICNPAFMANIELRALPGVSQEDFSL